MGILHAGPTKSLTFSRVFPKGCHGFLRFTHISTYFIRPLDDEYIDLSAEAPPDLRMRDEGGLVLDAIIYHTWIFQGVLNGWSGVPIHHPLGFKQHPLEDAGI